jgi:hypothetical protein
MFDTFWIRWALAAFVASCLLAGCDDDDPKPDLPDPTPTVSSTAPTEASTSPTASPSALGPEETVRAWVEARNSALQDGDTSAVDELSAPNCRSCEELNKVIREVYAAGGRFVTSGWRIDSIKMKGGSDPIQVDTALTFAPGQTIPSAGADPVSYDEERHIVTFRLSEAGSRYQVALVLFR